MGFAATAARTSHHQSPASKASMLAGDPGRPATSMRAEGSGERASAPRSRSASAGDVSGLARSSWCCRARPRANQPRRHGTRGQGATRPRDAEEPWPRWSGDPAEPRRLSSSRERGVAPARNRPRDRLSHSQLTLTTFPPTTSEATIRQCPTSTVWPPRSRRQLRRRLTASLGSPGRSPSTRSVRTALHCAVGRPSSTPYRHRSRSRRPVQGGRRAPRSDRVGCRGSDRPR